MPILNWLTRDEDVKAAAKVPYRLLEEVPDLSFGDKYNGNMLIQGDNLEALKALLPFYAGQVKCIFIDPPYNTKSAFEQYDDNLEHTKWLAMMWPRLEILHELLSDDGSLWITIDDNEVHYLKVLCDEIFGRKNFITNAIWQKKHTRQNDARYFSDNHDHILVFAKEKERFSINLLPRTAEMDAGYKNLDNDPRGPWGSQPLQVKTPSQTGIYTITTPSGRQVDPPSGRSWGVSEERYSELVADNRIWFGKTGDNVPRVKKFLSEVQQGLTPVTIWPHEEVGHNQHAKTEAKKFNSVDVFSTPKPEKLMERILHIASNEGDLILDSFAGSGTTGAVAHKMKRKWIMVELGDHCKTHIAPRIRTAINGEDQGGVSASTNWKGGGGFRFYRLGENAFDENGQICADIRFPVLAAHIWFSETNTPWNGSDDSPAIGIHEGKAYALLYNGILGDKRPQGGNVLTSRTLKIIRDEISDVDPDFSGQLIVYGESSRLGDARLKAEHITFKQTPYGVKSR